MSSAKADMLAAVASMSAVERAELAAAIGAAPSGPAVPKLSTTLDRLPDTEVSRVVAACRAGLKVAADNPGATDDVVGAELLKVSPAVFAAAQNNSIRRQKFLVHSLDQVAGYLGRRAGAAVAAAPTTPATATEKGGAR